ncbi:hypothetical protein PHMEG_00027827 [Phytophthora megakarya]|uniref:M96 mating-specific protein n=1 Tax=Phytophthora megakarya TaxID=4795 RepID=A0A225V7L1_9STRA|nr:hypothetical protein PHMEG_00027827 [Phytophthora megakarya]
MTTNIAGNQTAPSIQKKSSLSNGRKGRRGVPYTTALYRHHKAELDALRAEERQLSGQLQHLLPVYHGRTRKESIVAPSNVQREQLQWRHQAMIECKKRVHSESHNRELKEIYRRHSNLFHSIRGILKDNSTFEGFEFIIKASQKVDTPLFQLDNSKLILTELTSHLSEMYLERDMVISPLRNKHSLAFCTEKDHVSNHEMIMRITSVTPLECSIKGAGSALWNYVTDVSNSTCKESYGFNSQYESNNRVTLVASTRWLVLLDRFEFEDKHWIIIEPPPAGSEYSSVVRVYNQLRVINKGDLFSRQQLITRDVLLKCIAKLSRGYLQLMQNSFLEL